MSEADPGDAKGERTPFELEESPAPFELEADPAPDPAPAEPPRPPRPPASEEPATSEMPAASARSTGSRAPAQGSAGAPSADSPWAFLDERRRRRLAIYAPIMLVLYVVVGGFFLDTGLGWFALLGLGVGVFAGWRRQGEVLLGSVAAVAGLVASLLAVNGPSLLVIVATGVIGYVAGIDDRLRGG